MLFGGFDDGWTDGRTDGHLYFLSRFRDWKKKSKKSDIVTIGPPTYPTHPFSDIRFSDIFFWSLDPPYPMY